MCNACGFYCCASDQFEGCGCDCPEIECLIERCGGCGERFASGNQDNGRSVTQSTGVDGHG